jgi:phospholipase/lecithinase/hemolysin
VAAGFGLAFDRCLGTATTATGQVLAQAGSKVADLGNQLAAMTGDPLGEKDIAVVLVGMHDILDAYAVYAADPTTPKSVLLDQVRAAGTDLGNRVNALATAGPAVVVLTVPDLGLTPFAHAENASSGDSTRSALLSELTSAFNNRMSVALINDGRLIGLVFADIETQNEVKFPSAHSLTNVVDAACDVNVPLPDCTTATLTLTSGATVAGYMWADSLRPGPTFQARLGALAESRARNNPF